MVTRTPTTHNGNGKESLSAARTAAAYRLLPEANRNIGGYTSRRDIDVMLRGGYHQDNELSWYFYARIPELRYIARYVANSVSLARLFIGRVSADPFNPTPVGPRHPANDLLANFAGGQLGQSAILDRLGLHLTIPGDAVLAGPTDTPKAFPFDRWRVYSTTEITSRNGQLYYKTPTNHDQPVPSGVLPVRVWRSHPRLWWEADSPTKSSYTVLREIDLLDQHVHATAVSRLAGAGLLGIPDELTIAGDEVEVEGVETDPFVKMLTEVMSLAIKNRESAAAIVPIVLRGPAEYIQAIRHFDFSTKFDERVPELRNIALRRLALGMDTPPEVLLGMSDSSHWSAWATDESSVRLHTKPTMQLIVEALTEGWLRPTLESLPLPQSVKDDIPNLVVWFDLTNLQVRPNVADDAQALYDRFEIDAETLRLTAGFHRGSEPSKKELAKQILLSLVRSNPNMVPYAINALRSEFGFSSLPEAEMEGAAIGRPSTGLPVGDIEENPSIPGERSRDKQTAPPPTPPLDSDPNDND